MNINWMVDYDRVVKKEFTQDWKILYLEKITHASNTKSFSCEKTYFPLIVHNYNFLFLSYPEGKEPVPEDGWFKPSYKSIFGWDQ